MGGQNQDWGAEEGRNGGQRRRGGEQPPSLVGSQSNQGQEKATRVPLQDPRHRWGEWQRSSGFHPSVRNEDRRGPAAGAMARHSRIPARQRGIQEGCFRNQNQ